MVKGAESNSHAAGNGTIPCSPVARLHALWTLDGMDALSSDLVLSALSHAVPGLRENAMVLSKVRSKPKLRNG